MQELLKNKKVIVFDGVCLMCNKYVEFITKYDSNDYFRFVALQNKKILSKILKKKKLINDNTSIILIEDNTIKKKSSAVISILSNLKFPFYLFSITKIIPRFLRDMIYSLIARNRYNIFGKVKYCSVIENSNLKRVKEKIIE
tara:strand:- start:25380 stop:25805 length:426 start_codon:yes stop_codon:yes gene_type:complete